MSWFFFFNVAYFLRSGSVLSFLLHNLSVARRLWYNLLLNLLKWRTWCLYRAVAVVEIWNPPPSKRYIVPLWSAHCMVQVAHGAGFDKDAMRKNKFVVYDVEVLSKNLLPAKCKWESIDGRNQYMSCGDGCSHHWNCHPPHLIWLGLEIMGWVVPEPLCTAKPPGFGKQR